MTSVTWLQCVISPTLTGDEGQKCCSKCSDAVFLSAAASFSLNCPLSVFSLPCLMLMSCLPWIRWVHLIFVKKKEDGPRSDLYLWPWLSSCLQTKHRRIYPAVISDLCPEAAGTGCSLSRGSWKHLLQFVQFWWNLDERRVHRCENGPVASLFIYLESLQKNWPTSKIF